jgi:hypothetical protein
MPMRPRALPATLLALALAAAVTKAAAQDTPEANAPQPKPLFVRVSIHPTVSLSRFDYNNDLDLAEIRVYVELRLGSQEGPVVPNAVVTALGRKLGWMTDHYEKRLLLEGGWRPSEIDVEITAEDRAVIKERFPIPDWLTLTEPRPAVIELGQDLKVAWSFGRFLTPVDVSAYDFRTGKAFFQKDNQAGPAVVIPAASLPPSTIVRIYILPSWLYKRFLSGEAYARGSEVTIIPWSQVFVRTK